MITGYTSSPGISRQFFQYDNLNRQVQAQLLEAHKTYMKELRRSTGVDDA